MSDGGSNGAGDGAGEGLKQVLPPAARERLQSLRLADGVVSLLLDASRMAVPERARMERDLTALLRAQPGVTDVRIAMMADKPRRRLVAVASGKGGVGKSTLSANLAVALARMGRKVGLVDADIYGPSQPRLLATEGAKPMAEGQKLIPVETPWGVPLLSMGHLVEPGRAIAWRGPMAGNALSQLVDAEWGEAEILLIDLPPGTGDVQLTMLQRFKPAGAVIVSTPQDLALIDATRAISLFDQAQVPVIGVVENMAGYACPHCGEVSDPFGRGGAEAEAARLGHAFLGRVPLALSIREDSDAGKPPAAGDSAEGEAFAAIARKLIDWLDA